MCGRLVLTSSYKEKIHALFDELTADEWLEPRFNITPGQRVPVINQAESRHLTWMNWGFVPDAEPGRKDKRSLLINARAETVDRLPSFRHAFKSSRCVIIADGFYEWKRDPSQPKPQPYFFALKNSAAFALAGLMLFNKAGAGSEQNAGCVIVTTEANSLMHTIHNRMPVILTADAAWTWLSAGSAEDTLRSILQPYPSSEMTAHPVSERVNRATSEGPDLIAPVRILEQTKLF